MARPRKKKTQAEPAPHRRNGNGEPWTPDGGGEGEPQGLQGHDVELAEASEAAEEDAPRQPVVSAWDRPEDERDPPSQRPEDTHEEQRRRRRAG